MLSKRMLPLGAIGLLVGLALAGCGGAASANVAATPTPTCPAVPQISETTGTVTAINSTQMTVQTTTGEALVTLSTRTRYSSQQKATASDIQDGTRVQVVVKANSDGTYSAVQVAIRQALPGGGFPGGGNGGTPVPGRTPFPGRTPRPRGTATPGAAIPARCRTGAGRGGAGGAGGTGIVEGGLPSGAKVLGGTVATINGQYMTITGTDGTNYNIQLDSTTVISKIAAAQASDVKINDAVLASGVKAANGSVQAQAVTILLNLPTGQ